MATNTVEVDRCAGRSRVEVGPTRSNLRECVGVRCVEEGGREGHPSRLNKQLLTTKGGLSK